MFTDEEIETMGLQWVTAMHQSIRSTNCSLYLLGIQKGGLGAHINYDDHPMNRNGGFVFAQSASAN
jgi:hypothetical protein